MWLVPALVNDNGDFDFDASTAIKIYDSNAIDPSIANKGKSASGYFDSCDN